MPVKNNWPGVASLSMQASGEIYTMHLLQKQWKSEWKKLNMEIELA